MELRASRERKDTVKLDTSSSEECESVWREKMRLVGRAPNGERDLKEQENGEWFHESWGGMREEPRVSGAQQKPPDEAG